MRAHNIILYAFISYFNIVVVLMFIKQPAMYDERIVGLNVIGAIILLKATFEEYRRWKNGDT